MVWNEACKPRVQELKCWLVTMSMLKIPNVQENFVIYSDASKKKLGCVLMQHASKKYSKVYYNVTKRMDKGKKKE